METIINIKNLNFSYSSGKEILKDINLEIKKGEVFGVIGPTGAGKSTLLLHLNGILKGKGEILVDNILISEKTEKQIRGKVGVVFQNPDNQLFCPTVFEDIAFGLYNSGVPKEAIDYRVNEILDKLNLSALKDRSSHHLSFGEKKRIALATILVMKPEVLCFDEPFANLDYGNIFKIITEIRELPITRILISQDILLALSLCDRIAVMNQGTIVKVDTSENIARDHQFLKEIGIDFVPYLEMVGKFLPN